MEKLVIFITLSIPVALISKSTFFNFRSHGFYRFISWECILWLLICNAAVWFDEPFSVRQIFSWVLLCCSVYPVTAGMVLLKKTGKPTKSRNDKRLYDFEKTTELVTIGIYRYIRHPMYSSLLLLTWGIFLKRTELPLLMVALVSTISLYLTAIFEVMY